MVQYPIDMPTDALMLMLDKVRGKDVEVPKLIAAAWNVAGYGLGKWQPTKDQLPFGDSPEPTDDEALSQLIAFQSSGQEPVQGVVIGLVIGVAVKLALKFLASYLS